MTISHDINPADDLQTIAAKLKTLADAVVSQVNTNDAGDAAVLAALALGLNVAPSTVAATGSTQANAAALALGFNLVTAADATKGVKLPTAVAKQICFVKNNANAVLKVWPNTSDAINAAAADASIDMAAFTSAIFYSYNGVTWYTIPLVPS